MSADRRTLKDRSAPEGVSSGHSGQRKAWNGRYSPAVLFFQKAPVPATASAPADPDRQARISELLPWFIEYAKFERRLSQQTVVKYRESLGWVIRMIGDLAPGAIRPEHVLKIKADCAERGAGPSRVASLIHALKSFLVFCRLSVGLETFDLKQIRAPRLPKREVSFLTPEEVRKFLHSIPLRKPNGRLLPQGICFRALVEVLLGTGMRISEALSLTRSGIDLKTGEAVIIGKGNKQRSVFFSPRALNWIKEYLNRRSDACDAVFAIRGRPLRRDYALQWFRRFRKQIGFPKRVTAHVLRHTVATTLLFNGCPIGHIKEILGHEHLQTTCQYYLGTDKRAAKDAHSRYLDYDDGILGTGPGGGWGNGNLEAGSKAGGEFRPAGGAGELRPGAFGA